jgi:hypothetical protein
MAQPAAAAMTPYVKIDDPDAGNRRKRRFDAVKIADLVRKAKFALQHPDQALKKQLRAMHDLLAEIDDPELAASVKAEANKTIAEGVYDGLLAMVPIEPPPKTALDHPKQVVVRLADRRALIRESRGYIGQAGPPPRALKTPIGPCGKPGAEATLPAIKFNRFKLSGEFNPLRKTFQPGISGNGDSRLRGRP